MKKKRYILMTSLVTALLLAFSACTQDEIVGGDDSLLPDGQYPLLIGDVSIVAQSSEEPWTRVAENTTDGGSSVWETGDVIGIKLVGGQSYAGGPNTFTSVGQYTVATDNGNVSLSVVTGKEVFWKNKYRIGTEYWTNASGSGVENYGGGLTAWYPDQTDMSLADQSKELSYVLKGAMPEDKWYTYESTIPLTFTHQLAKVRVKLEGERVSQVTKVEVYGYTSCTNTQGTVTTEGASQGWITMHQATYGTETCWEANLVPGEIGNQDAQPFVRLNGTTEVPISTLKTLVAGKLHAVTVKVNAYPSDATEITSSTGNISDDGKYYVTGKLTSAINITGGSPHIYLYNANVTNSAGSAISITNGATPIIHVVGKNNTVKCTGSSGEQEGAGIYVASGSGVTIQGNGRSDVLTTQAGRDGAGIGGYGRITNLNNTVKPCGNITIKNVTVYAYSTASMYYSPGIGSAGACGTIEIEGATVHARAIGQDKYFSPAIGSCTSTAPTVTISDSDIYAYRGGYNKKCTADYIGRGSGDSYEGGKIQGSISNTTVYKYTYEYASQETIDEGTQVFE